MDNTSAFSIGSSIGHYRLVRKIGAGGMGSVYLAEDLSLRRQVALKFFREDWVYDENKLRRFQQEAQAAARLSHRNIVVIHEINFSGPVPFLAMEYVKGITLRERLATGPAPLSESLEIARQLASALAAAHSAGIVHRDLKPENIVLQEDGAVKVLDFGLAKMSREDPGSRGDETVTNLTLAGSIIGTPSYMSPEQAKGLAADGRTDLFALGAIVYELLTGVQAFPGSSPTQALAAVLSAEPDPLPPALAVAQPLVSRLLRKNPEQRYASAVQVLEDLTRIAAEESAKRPRRRSRWPAVVAAAGVLAIALAGWTWLHRVDSEHQGALQIARLTSAGKTRVAAVSPDGRLLAYSLIEDGKHSLWLRETHGTANGQLLAPGPEQIWGITFAPDGTQIFFVRTSPGNPRHGDLYVIPATAGATPRRLISDVQSSVTFAPQGRELAFFRAIGDSGRIALMIASAEGSNQRQISVRRSTDFIPEHTPAWSPDGKIIACASPGATAESGASIIGVAADGGGERPLSDRSLYYVRQMVWSNDGNELLVIGQERLTAYYPQIYQLRIRTGELRRLTDGVDAYQTLDTDASRRVLVSVQERDAVSITIASLAGAAPEQTVQSVIGNHDGRYGLTWLNPAEIAFTSSVSGESLILAASRTAGNLRQITFSPGGDYDPSLTPDGRTLLIASNRDGPSRRIWAMDADGSNLRPISDGPLDWLPRGGPGTGAILYAAAPGGARSVWRAGLNHAAPMRLIGGSFANHPDPSPDGTQFACLYEARPGAGLKLAIFPIEGGTPIRLLDLPEGAETQAATFRWTADGRSIALIVTRKGVSNIWAMPAAGGEPRPLTHFTAAHIFKFAISPGGDAIACSRGSVNWDVVSIVGAL